jgi:hypothetical protein
LGEISPPTGLEMIIELVGFEESPAAIGKAMKEVCADVRTLNPQPSALDSPLNATVALGKRLGKAMKEVCAGVRALTNVQLKEFEQKGSIMVCGHELTGSDIKISLNFSGDLDNLQVRRPQPEPLVPRH